MLFALVVLITAVGGAIAVVRCPLASGAALLFLTITVHERLQVSRLFGGALASPQGGVSLLDALWMGYAAVFLFWLLVKAKPLKYHNRLPPDYWLAAPYVALSILLPLIGGVSLQLLDGEGLSFVSTAIRQLQWLAFGLFAYVWSTWYGVRAAATAIYVAVALAVVAHSFQAIVQWLIVSGRLPSSFNVIDRLYTSNIWFQISPRPTGLALEPTALGVVGALGLGLGISWFVAGRRGAVWHFAVVLASGVALLLSSDRLILAGAALGVVAALLLRTRGHFTIRMATLLFAGGVSVYVGFLALPSYHVNRILRLVNLQVIGDKNITERLERWGYYLTDVVPRYPLGTGIQPTYAGGLPVDNYYLSTFVQGSAIYLVSYLLFLVFLTVVGYRLQQRRFKGNEEVGLFLVYVAVLVASSSLGAAPMFDIALQPVLWACLGVGLHMLRYSGRARNPTG